MKKFIAMLSSVVLCCSYSPVYVKAAETAEKNLITVENSPELWERFLKYDLCIFDYDFFTDDKKDLCKFIFETELNFDDTIICERVIRILVGYDVGERVTLDAVKQTPHIADKALYCRNGALEVYANSIDGVPDIKHTDYDCYEFEYWA